MNTNFLSDFLWLFSVLAGLAIEEVLKNSYGEFMKTSGDPLHYLMLAAFFVSLTAFHISNLTYYRFVHEEGSETFNAKRFLFDYIIHLAEYVLFFWMAELLAHSSPLFFALFFALLYGVDWLWIWLGMKAKLPSHVCAKQWMETSQSVVVGILLLWLAIWGAPHFPGFPWTSEQITPWCLSGGLLIVIAMSVMDMRRTYRFYLKNQSPATSIAAPVNISVGISNEPSPA